MWLKLSVAYVRPSFVTVHWHRPWFPVTLLLWPAFSPHNSTVINFLLHRNAERPRSRKHPSPCLHHVSRFSLRLLVFQGPNLWRPGVRGPRVRGEGGRGGAKCPRVQIKAQQRGPTHYKTWEQSRFSISLFWILKFECHASPRWWKMEWNHWINWRVSLLRTGIWRGRR